MRGGGRSVGTLSESFASFTVKTKSVKEINLFSYIFSFHLQRIRNLEKGLAITGAKNRCFPSSRCVMCELDKHR